MPRLRRLKESPHPHADDFAPRALAVGVKGGHAEKISLTAFQAVHSAGLFHTRELRFPARPRGGVGGGFHHKCAAAHGSLPTEFDAAFKLGGQGAEVERGTRLANGLTLAGNVQSGFKHGGGVATRQGKQSARGKIGGFAGHAHQPVAAFHGGFKSELERFHFHAGLLGFGRPFTQVIAGYFGTFGGGKFGNAIGDTLADEELLGDGTIIETELVPFHGNWRLIRSFSA